MKYSHSIIQLAQELRRNRNTIKLLKSQEGQEEISQDLELHRIVRQLKIEQDKLLNAFNLEGLCTMNQPNYRKHLRLIKSMQAELKEY